MTSNSRAALERFQEVTIAFATGDKQAWGQWEEARASLLDIPELYGRLPQWVVEIRWSTEFWQFIKKRHDNYADRRSFIWDSLRPLFDHLEHGASRPIAQALAPIIERGEVREVTDAWTRIRGRQGADPEGTITAARTLVESVCKWILDQRRIEYSDKDDLPALYSRVAGVLKLSPENHKEQVFKQILGGCLSVVNGLAAVRNAFGDAHGKGARAPKPSARHAELAVNMAGTLASFLLATDKEQREA